MSTPPAGGPPDDEGRPDDREGWGEAPPPPPPGSGAPPPPGGEQPPPSEPPAQPGQPSQAGQPGQQPAWGQQQWGQQQPPAAAYTSGGQTNGLAIGGLIASILGVLTLWMCGIGLIGVIIGLVLGYMGRNQIRASAGQQTGEGLAMGAIVVGWVGVGLSVLWFLMVVVFGLFGTFAPF